VRHAFKLMTLIIDFHEDLAWNMINLDRDYTQSAYDIRSAEKDTPIPAFNGNSLLGWQQYQEANIAIIAGTLFCSPRRLQETDIELHNYGTPQEAHTCYRKNLDAYNRLTDEHPEKFRLILNQPDLADHINQWQAHQIEEIIVALEPDEKEQLLQRLAVCEKHPDVRVRVYPGTGELYLGRVDLSELAGLPLIETPERWRTGVRLFYKRVVDLLIATAGMVVLFIPGLVVALLIFLEGVIRRESRGPVFFIQDRLGRDQKSFRLVKFRTMIRTAEENGPILASKLDPRVTRTGWWLRRSGLDELPQLYNVLRGEMSLVGPRPERKEFVKQFLAEHPAYGIRFRLRPGITGLAQIHGFYGSAVESKMRYDLVYTANFSLFLDFWILFKTLQVILTGRKKI